MQSPKCKAAVSMRDGGCLAGDLNPRIKEAFQL